MDTLNHSQFEQLVYSEGGPHLSAFLPAPRSANLAADDAIRIGNLVRHARKVLAAHWMRESDADEFLSKLVDLAKDREFLAPRRQGLAIYLAEKWFAVFQLPDSAVAERIVIAKSFAIRPLVPLLNDAIPYHILTISKHQIRLFLVEPPEITPVDVPGLPASFVDSLQGNSADRGSQMHSAAVGLTSKQGAVFHGQGGRPDAEKADLEDYLRHVETAITSFIGDRGGSVILAGVDFETAIYRKLNHCDRVLNQSIVGNVDQLSPAQLLERSRPIAENAFAELRKTDAEAVSSGRRAPVVTDPEQVLGAAHEGRIDLLFADKDASIHGSFYSDTRTMRSIKRAPTGDPSDPCRDLIELAMVETIKHRGRVHAVARSEMPVDAPLVAALRY